MGRSGTILIVDDNMTTLEIMRTTLELSGHTVFTAQTGQNAMEIVRSRELDLVLLDLSIEGRQDGLEILRSIKNTAPQVFVFIVTGSQEVDAVIQAFRGGAKDYLRKPVHREALLNHVASAVALRDLGRKRASAELEVERQRDQLEGLRREIERSYAFTEILGVSSTIQDLRHLLSEVSRSDVTLLITGESGTGKSLAARAVHYNSLRRQAPFVEANCVVYADTLLNSELFGHEKGAFTGAVKRKRGRFELAHGGTIFLDEIGDLKPSTQLLLLRVLQDRTFERVGGEETLEADVRVMAATNRDLAKKIEAGTFRQDLFYRLNVFPIEIPPLRDRVEDVPVLTRGILARRQRNGADEAPEVTPEVLQRFMEHPWPGNIRELQNVLEYASVLAKGGVIEMRHLPPNLRGSSTTPLRAQLSLAEMERRYIAEVLENSGQNKKLTAQILGIQRSTLYSKLRRYQL